MAKKASPIRIIFYGGALATALYLLWTNYGDVIKEKATEYFPQKQEKVVVRNVFKNKHTYKNKKTKSKSKSKTKGKQAEEFSDEEFSFKPITEDERISLILKARENIESRLDPFGQEAALPPSTIEKIKETKETVIPEIKIERKQVELVGIISARDKDLALVNIYTAEFTVTPDDTEESVEDELKKSLGKAVPNRIEVYVLDPVEDWFVKSIKRSKSRSDDPSIELVKENKKFRLRVGQKVLLPTEKSFTDLVEEYNENKANKDDIADLLGL